MLEVQASSGKLIGRCRQGVTFQDSQQNHQGVTIEIPESSDPNEVACFPSPWLPIAAPNGEHFLGLLSQGDF